MFLNYKLKLKTNSSFPKKTTINSSKNASVEGTSRGYFCHNRMLALLCHYWLCRNRKKLLLSSFTNIKGTSQKLGYEIVDTSP